MIKFETKIIVAVSLFLAIGLSILNGINMTFFKLLIKEKLDTEIKLYSRVCKVNANCKLPSYFYTSPVPSIDKSTKPVAKVNDGFLMVNVEHVNSELKSIAAVIFIWEAIILVVLVLIVVKAMNYYVKKERNVKEFLRLLLLVLTHKLGNLLAIQRLNIDMIESSCGKSDALERLKRGYSLLESDFYFVLDSVKEIGKERAIENVNLKEVTEQVFSQISPLAKGKKLDFKLEPALVKMNGKDAENLIYFLLENALKYSKSAVRIRTGKVGETVYFAVCNDIASRKEAGRGVGLELAKFLTDKYRGRLRTKVNGNFCVFLGFR